MSEANNQSSDWNIKEMFFISRAGIGIETIFIHVLAVLLAGHQYWKRIKA